MKKKFASLLAMFVMGLSMFALPTISMAQEPQAMPQQDYVQIALPTMASVPQGTMLDLNFWFLDNDWSGWYWREADYFVTKSSVTSDWKVAQLLNVGINQKISGFTHKPGTTSQREWKGKLDTTNLAPGNYKIWVAVTANVWTSYYSTRTFTVTPNSNLIHPSSVSLNRSSYSFNKGQSMQLSATVLPSNATNKSVTWKSSKPSVATVDSNGKVKALGNGAARITATTNNGKTASCVVTVKTPAKSVTLDKTIATVDKGKTTQLSVKTYSPTSVYPKTIKWVSQNSSIATVDSTGKVKGIATGSTYIYAKTWNSVFAKCKVTVK